jgi:hypothetical protein
MNLNIERAFKYPLSDPNWISKVLIGALISLIPFVNFMAFGYFLKCIRNISEGNDETLPEWTDFGALFLNGAVMVGINLIYIMPYLTCMGISIAVMALGVTAGSGHNNDGGLIAVIMLAPMFMWIFTLIYILALSLVLPAIIYLYATRGDFRSAFNFSEIIAFIKGNLVSYIVMLLLDYLAFTIAGFGILACGAGILFTSFFAHLFASHLLGQMVALIREDDHGDNVSPHSAY